MFQGFQDNESKDLINFIIMTLHEELNKSPKNPNPNINIVDKTNNDKTLKNFFINFSNENQSIISDIFYGTNYTRTQCSYCKTINHSYQTFFILIFPLEKIRKFKIQQNQLIYTNMNQINNYINPLNSFNLNTVNIYDCFYYNEKFDEENLVYCDICKQKVTMVSKTVLYFVPEILIFIVNIGNELEDNVKLEFYENINLINYITAQNTGFKFKLIGVVTINKGESYNRRHFIAYCMSPISLEWFKYDDDLVTPVVNFKEEVIDSIPYILFYQKIDGMN